MAKMDTNGSGGMDVEQIAESQGSIFHDSVPELLKLTCFRLTIDLWSCSLLDPADNLENTFKNKINHLIEELNEQISDSTKNMISWYSKRILKLSSMWVAYHKESAFKDWDVELIRGMCFPELIWRPDGSIDNLKSAQALIESFNLRDEQEYRLLCLYCLEDRIMNMWPRLVEKQSVVLDVFFDEEISLLSYWNSRMAGYFSESGMKSVENRLLANETIDNLSAAIYFFNCFTSEERVVKGCQLIPCVKLDERAEYVKTMLSKFNEEELHRAFQYHCSDIMYPLMMNCVYAKCTIKVWDRVKNMLTIQSFLSIMTRITGTLRTALKNSDRRFVDEIDNYDDFKRHIFTTIGDLWSITPDSLKKNDLTLCSKGVVPTLVECYVNMKIDWDPEVRFIFNILSNADWRVSWNFMYKFSSKLRNICRLSSFRDLFQLSGPTRTIKISPEILRDERSSDMFHAKKFVELEDYLEMGAIDRGHIQTSETIRESKNFERSVLLMNIDDPTDMFIYPFDLNSDEIKQLRKFIIATAEHYPQFAANFRQMFYSYYPQLWPEPVEMDDHMFVCYSGLECL